MRILGFTERQLGVAAGWAPLVLFLASFVFILAVNTEDTCPYKSQDLEKQSAFTIECVKAISTPATKQGTDNVHAILGECSDMARDMYAVRLCGKGGK